MSELSEEGKIYGQAENLIYLLQKYGINFDSEDKLLLLTEN
jgi:hypothetical protein